MPEGTSLPELWDTRAVASFLGFSEARVRQIKSRHSFPEPAYPRLNGGAVWLAADIRQFDKGWDRTKRPGRPSKKAAPAAAETPQEQEHS